MIIIGEKINATVPKIKEAILNKDADTLAQMAIEQEKAGAEFIDINVGTGEGTFKDEINNIEWLVGIVKDNVQVSLCIDSADYRVLEAGLRAGGYRVGMINSVKATEESISEIMPLASEHGVSVVALAMDESGIPKEVSARIQACEKILNSAEKYKIPAEKIFFDPLVMPVGTDNSQGMITLKTLLEIKGRFTSAKTVLALSNISFGLPKRSLVNIALLHMAQFLSVDALIINPLDNNVMHALRAGEALLGIDRHCRKYTRALRQKGGVG